MLSSGFVVVLICCVSLLLFVSGLGGFWRSAGWFVWVACLLFYKLIEWFAVYGLFGACALVAVKLAVRELFVGCFLCWLCLALVFGVVMIVGALLV